MSGKETRPLHNFQVEIRWTRVGGSEVGCTSLGGGAGLTIEHLGEKTDVKKKNGRAMGREVIIGRKEMEAGEYISRAVVGKINHTLPLPRDSPPKKGKLTVYRASKKKRKWKSDLIEGEIGLLPLHIRGKVK